MQPDRPRPSIEVAEAMPQTLRASGWGKRAWGILAHALQAVDPGIAVGRHLERSGRELIAAGQTYRLEGYRRVRLVAIGKAADPMARAAASILEPYLTDGILVTKPGHWQNEGGSEKLERLEAGHPIPDQRSVSAAQRIAGFLANSREDDLVLILISGGGSALLAHPAEGITLDDLQFLTHELLACGATIQQMNTLRKHLDLIKGGGLARFAAPATQIALILSDVVGDPLDMIASGPTVPDPTTYFQAQTTIHDLGIQGRIPTSIGEHILRGTHGLLPETPKPGDAIFNRVQNAIIGSNSLAVEAAWAKAEAVGFHSLILTTYLSGEACQAGQFLGNILRETASNGRPLPRPACLIAGGETTVTLQQSTGSGLGGRNQELALGAVTGLAGLADVALIALATDGGDGPTDAAGAIVTGDTLDRAQKAGLDPADFLASHDAYHFFKALDDLIITGPTLTNVNDLVLLFSF